MCHADANRAADGNSHEYAGADSHTDSHTDRDRYTGTDEHAHGNANQYTPADKHANRDADRHTDCNADGDAVCHLAVDLSLFG